MDIITFKRAVRQRSEYTGTELRFVMECFLKRADEAEIVDVDAAHMLLAAMQRLDAGGWQMSNLKYRGVTIPVVQDALQDVIVGSNRSRQSMIQFFDILDLVAESRKSLEGKYKHKVDVGDVASVALCSGSDVIDMMLTEGRRSSDDTHQFVSPAHALAHRIGAPWDTLNMCDVRVALSEVDARDFLEF